MSRTRTVDELRALAEAGAAEVGDASAEEVIAWAARHFDLPAVGVACSMADGVLPHLVSQAFPGVDVLFLDTGYHFAETLATRDEVERTLDVNIVDITPAQTVAEQDATWGKDLFASNPAQCCELRKVIPLNNTLKNYELWFTGVRRDEAPTRTNTPLVAWDEKHQMVKVNPVASWSYDQLMDYANERRVPLNILLFNGYPSIGCAPCTRKVAPGDDPRSGRWAGTVKTECGIHV